MDITFREYTGNVNYNCSGGCPGECARHDVHCYTEYKCREQIMIPAMICGLEEGAPFGVACQEGPDNPIFFCVPCKKDTSFSGVDVNVINRTCGYGS
jgi:hypothetical protein